MNLKAFFITFKGYHLLKKRKIAYTIFFMTKMWHSHKMKEIMKTFIKAFIRHDPHTKEKIF